MIIQIKIRSKIYKPFKVILKTTSMKLSLFQYLEWWTDTFGDHYPDHGEKFLLRKFDTWMVDKYLCWPFRSWWKISSPKIGYLGWWMNIFVDHPDHGEKFLFRTFLFPKIGYLGCLWKIPSPYIPTFENRIPWILTIQIMNHGSK